MHVWCRLGPGADPIQAITEVVGHLGLDSGSIVQCMGSFAQVALMIVVPDGHGGWRFSDPMVKQGPMEMVSAQGSWGRDGETGQVAVHLHGLVIDSEGRAHGGHFLPGGSRVLATCEIGLLAAPGLTIRRAFDPAAGCPVLKPDLPSRAGG